MNTIHYNLTLVGKVQGVSLRVYAKKKADELGLTGVIKNEKDGTVQIEAEGNKASLDEFVSWCYEGSQAAEVKNVIVSAAPLKNYLDFKIKY